MARAFIETDSNGNLTDDSTCTVIAGSQVMRAAVPPANVRRRGSMLVGSTYPHRIAEALVNLGYEPDVTHWDEVRYGVNGGNGQTGMWMDVRPTPPSVATREDLAALAGRLGVRPDWHEPDEQGLTARVVGASFDNAGGRVPRDNRSGEMHVVLTRTDEETGESEDVAAINLADLLAWATGLES